MAQIQHIFVIFVLLVAQIYELANSLVEINKKYKMNEITKLEAEFNRIEKLYMQKRESLNINNENYFSPILEYTKLSKEFTEKDCPKLTKFAEKLMIDSNDENIQKTITENTANFMTELSFKIIYS